MIVRVIVVFFFLVVFLYGIGRGIAWIISKAKDRMKPKGKAMELLLKEHNFPKLLQLTPNHRKTAYIFVFTLVFYIVCFYVLGCCIFGDFISHNRIGGFITFFEIQLIIAIFTGIFRHIIARVIRKSKHESLISTFQFFLFFSALPYLVLFYPNNEWKGYISLGGTFGRLIFYFGVILPEIVGFLGFVFLRKKVKILGIIIIAIAFLAGIEILPIRRTFLFYETWPTASLYKELKPFGKLDREFEFKRSLRTIEDLVVKSNSYPSESLVTITLYMPDLEKNPNILRLNTERLDWKDLLSQFEKKVFRLNVKLDSDGDGLSDFREAELLSDAHNSDTDGDGINDREDSDPLNPYEESDFGEIKAAVLGFYVDSFPFYLIENNFHDGRGEFGNFDKHVIILNYKQLRLWDDIFAKQHISKYSPIYRGPGGSDLPYIAFLEYSFDIFRRISIVLVRLDHGIDSDGVLYLLIKWRGEWRVMGGRVLWT